MPVNRNALLRYQTIDRCLSNPYRQWTLEDLIEACSEALYEYDGSTRGVSRRTIQADLQMMRSDRLGYNAPIEVYDNKYYRYSEPNFSITRLPLSTEAVEEMQRAVEVFGQFESFDFFVGISESVNKLRDYLALSDPQRRPIIQFEQNKNLKGLHWISPLYTHILRREVLTLSYQSFKALHSQDFVVSPYLLKEYNNRWFLVARYHRDNRLLVLALDRLQEVRVNSYVPYLEAEDFDPASFFDDVIGVTRYGKMTAEPVRLWVSHESYPYIETKPLHHSQRVIERGEHRDHILELSVVVNPELVARLLSFGPNLRVLSPRHLVRRMAALAHRLAGHYEALEEQADSDARSPLERIGR